MELVPGTAAIIGRKRRAKTPIADKIDKGEQDRFILQVTLR